MRRTVLLLNRAWGISVFRCFPRSTLFNESPISVLRLYLQVIPPFGTRVIATPLPPFGQLPLRVSICRAYIRCREIDSRHRTSLDSDGGLDHCSVWRPRCLECQNAGRSGGIT